MRTRDSKRLACALGLLAAVLLFLLVDLLFGLAIQEWWTWRRLVAAIERNDAATAGELSDGFQDLSGLIPMGVHHAGWRLDDVAAAYADVATLEQLRRSAVHFDRFGATGMLPAALAIQNGREPAVIGWLLERVRESSVDNDDNLSLALRSAVFRAAEGLDPALPEQVLDLYKSPEKLRRDLSDTLGDAIESATMNEALVRRLASRGVDLEYRRSPGGKTLRERAEARGRLAWLTERR